MNYQESKEAGFPAYAWPGGYPVIYVCTDGGTLCPKCAREDGEAPTHDDGSRNDSGWGIVGSDIHYEGPPEVCDHCGTAVESAYGDPEDND